MLVLCLLTQAKSCTLTHAHCVSLLRVCMCAKKKKKKLHYVQSRRCVLVCCCGYTLYFTHTHNHSSHTHTHIHSHPHTETHTIKMIALANAVRQHRTRCCCLPAACLQLMDEFEAMKQMWQFKYQNSTHTHTHVHPHMVCAKKCIEQYESRFVEEPRVFIEIELLISFVNKTFDEIYRTGARGQNGA